MTKVYVHRLGEWYQMYMNSENEELLSSFAEVVNEKDRQEPMTEDELVERMQGAEILLSLNGIGANEITNRVLERVGTIKYIVISHWWQQFDGQDLDSLGIQVVEGGAANSISVAEWVLAVSLMGLKQLNNYYNKLKSGSSWGEPRWTPGVGMLCDKKIGLVGFGRVGRYTASYFKALGAKVSVYDKYMPKDDYIKYGVSECELDRLLAESDIVSLHLPINDGTKHILTAEKLSLIRDGALFINSARAALYDEDELVMELKKNRFSAYIDVFSQEPLPLDSSLRTLDNCFITPHIAGHNYDMFFLCGKQAIETIKQYCEGNGMSDHKFADQ